MKSMLVPVDLSNAAPGVVSAAVALAKPMGVEIVLLHVTAPEPEFVGYDPGPQSVRDAIARQFAGEKHALEVVEAGVRSQGIPVRALVIQGLPAEKILAEAKKLDAAMIVLGSHGHGMLHHLLVGSVAEGVIRKSTCPVLIVPHRG